jgi:transposase-like protein
MEAALGAGKGFEQAITFGSKLSRCVNRTTAAYPVAFSSSQVDKTHPPDCKLRRVKYLSNVIGQSHRFVKKKVRASQCFKRFHPAKRTLEGIETTSMMRKGQVKRLSGSDARGQVTFVVSLFGFAA